MRESRAGPHHARRETDPRHLVAGDFLDQPFRHPGFFQLTIISLAAYVAYSALLVFYSRHAGGYAHEQLVHWADASFFLYVVALTGNTNSPYFFLFYFAILAASFR